MNVDPPFRFITINTIISLLFSLAPAQYGQEIKTLLRSAYESSIKLIKDLCKLEGLFSFLFDIFKEQWKFFASFKSSQGRVNRQVLGDPLLLCGIMDDPKVRNSEYLHFPIGQKDTAISYIRVFLSFKEGYQKYILGLSDKEINACPLSEKEEEEEIKLLNSVYLLNESKKLITCYQVIKNEVLNRYNYIFFNNI